MFNSRSLKFNGNRVFQVLKKSTDEIIYFLEHRCGVIVFRQGILGTSLQKSAPRGQLLEGTNSGKNFRPKCTKFQKNLQEKNQKEEGSLHFFGYHFDRGLKSPYFLNSLKGENIVLKNCLLLFYDGVIEDFEILIPPIELSQTLKRPLAIIAGDIEGDALYSLILSRKELNHPVVAVQAPTFEDSCSVLLEDISTVTGGIVFKQESDDLDMEYIMPSDFGEADEVIIKEDKTVVINGKGSREDIEELVNFIKFLIDISVKVKKDDLQGRLNQLTQ